jgi:cyclopropane-fatty-acyl-phospholipid synthase
MSHLLSTAQTHRSDGGPLNRRVRAAAHRLLGRLRQGELRLREAGEERVFGGAEGGASLGARIDIHDPAVYRRLALGGSIGAAESYMDGDWDCDDLASLSRLLIRNEEVFGDLDRGSARLLRAFHLVAHRLRRNTRQRARRNIAEHYDLGNDFFESFLDPTLTYSAGIFESDQASLEDASVAKYERICRKLRMRPEDHVLEIGSGWGGFALHAAGLHGCRVTTTTISRRQWEEARERVAEAGLQDRVTVLLEDYRNLSGSYDKLVSIEMIEAVGHEYLDDYFGTCCQRLDRDGAMLLQAITVPDQRFDQSKRSVDFIKRYVFPGGCLPSVHAILDACKRRTDFQLVQLEDITPHYAETLARWHGRLRENARRIRQRGYPEPLLRLWGFYLASCQAAFAERYVADVQLTLVRPGFRGGAVLGRIGDG